MNYNCVECGGVSTMKPENITHKYKESGLDNVILKNVVRLHCSKCGEETFNFGDIEQLHNLIATTLIKKKKLLTGKEVRFLRKYMGYNSQIFAKLLRRTPETISRMENASEVSDQFDRLIRFVVMTKSPDRKYDLHDQILRGKGLALDSIKLKKLNHKWTFIEEAA